MARAAPLIAAALGPSERILAGAKVDSAKNLWLMYLPVASVPCTKHHYLVLTDYHLVFCKIPWWTGRPTEVEFAVPRDQVRISNYRRGDTRVLFDFVFPGRDKPSPVRALRVFRPEIESMLGQLGVLRPAPGQPYPPRYAPPPGQYPPQYAPPPGDLHSPPPGR